jgi:hypothetical protein
MPAAALTLGSHRLEFRATVTYRDAPESETSDRVSRCTAYAPAAESVREPVIAQFTKTLSPLTITIFEQYPGELPEVVNASSMADSIDSWFRPERLRVVQERLPEGTGSALVVSNPRWGPLVGMVCRASGTASGLLMGIEISGSFSITPEIPIAAIAEWRSQGGGAVLSFPIVSGGGVFRLGEQLRFGKEGTFAAISDQEQPLQSLLVDRPRDPPSFFVNRAGSPRFGLGLARFREPIWLGEVLRDGSMPGVLDVRPARELALASFFGKYLGNLTRPVLLDILTLESQWVDDPRCATARRSASQGVAPTS